MKLQQRLIEPRLSTIHVIANNPYGFTPAKSTTEPSSALRMVQEKYREKGQDLHLVIVVSKKSTIECRGS